jgi:hypothetical protein
MNLSLLCKWWWKLEMESGLWQDIINYKYLRRENIFSVKHKQTDSPIWADMLKIKNIYLQVGRSMSMMVRQPWFGRILGCTVSP